MVKNLQLKLVVPLLLAGLAGCGDGSIGTVTGTVKLDGEPLADARVTFYPQIDASEAFDNAGTSAGRTDENGVYELIYNRDTKGALVGEHLVYIETLQEGGGGDYGQGRKEMVPKRYNSESELKVTVKSGSNTIDFLDLTSEGDKNVGRNVEGAY
ncbi:MAG TPA: hypothetical protein DDW52_02415 [Planctomycetaceae bacterium]|nr:hypothetical protein [Planctomycetaceae bacterium]